MQTRLAYIDLASGIMIVWVMLFHTFHPMYAGAVLRNIPYLYFFMPWFFYKSGMLFKPKDIKLEWQNGVNKLLVPFAFWTLISYVLYILTLLRKGEFSVNLVLLDPLRTLLLAFHPPLNIALWFLPVLFLVRQIANFLLPRVNALWIAAGALCICVIYQLIEIPFFTVWMKAIVWGLFFFALAYWIKDHETNKWLIIIATVTYLISLFTPITYVYNEEAPLWSRLAYYPSCGLACIFFNNICRHLITLPQRIFNVCYHFPILSYIGQNAMYYYVAHSLVLYITLNTVRLYNETWYIGWQGIIITIIVYAVVLTCISHLLNLYHDRTVRRQPYNCR